MILSLAVKEMFEGNEMNIYTNENNDVFMTREQIGQALEYSNPRIAISNLHKRHKVRLDKFSSVIKLSTEAGERETTVYSEQGVYEIIRRSEQPKADDFYDWVYDLLSKLRKGDIQVVQPKGEYEKLQIQKMRAEAMLNNSR